VASTAGSGRARAIGAAVAATLAAPFLLYLIARMIPAPLPPADPLLAVRKTMFEAVVPTRRVSDEELVAAGIALRKAPLAYEPFYVAARHAEQSGDLARARMLMEEVRRRRANFVPARLHLAAYYGQEERFREMFAEVDVALRLNAQVRDTLLAEMTRLIALPDGRRELATALARNPAWRRDFFTAAHSRPFEPAAALDLYNQVRARRPNFTPSFEYRLYLESLVRTGQVGRARALWLNTLAPAQRGNSALLFDGDFSGVRALPPFGWVLAETEQGRAEMARDGRPHLQVDYFGGSNEVLAEQILALSPGSYRLEFAARSEEGVSGANISWVVACYPSGTDLNRAGVSSLTQNFQRGTMRFTVPAGQCNGQVLRLVGEPGDVSVPVAFQIASTRIVR
jgi:tetratricopeptide (TPR) repeat protein